MKIISKSYTPGYEQLNEQDHVTTIMITHDATEIAAADQLAKVVAGRLEVHG